MSQPVKIAILGAGFSRATHIPAFLRLQGEFDVAAIFSRTAKHAQQAASRFPYAVKAVTSIEEALSTEGLEAVDIALPIGPADDAVRRSFRRRLHVYSEKPIAADLKTARELMTLHAEREPRAWCVGETARFFPWDRVARQLVEEGKIGTPILAHVPMYVPVKATPWFTTQWRKHPDYQGGFLFDGGVHDTARMRDLFGEALEVNAYTRQADKELIPLDSVVASLRFESGMIASYSASYALDMPSLSKTGLLKGVVTGALRRKDDRFGGRLHILGTSGSVFIAGGKVELFRGTRRQVFSSKTPFPMLEELKDFHSAIKGKAAVNTPLEGFRDASLIHAILQSASSGKSVNPELV
jgi:predicted dehydrogenase